MKDKKNAGHRQRLREKFLKSQLTGFHDYEIIELLLTFGIPRQDCKLLAKELLEHFKHLSGVFDASIEELMAIKGIGRSTAILINYIKEIAGRYARERILEKDGIKSLQEVLEYCRLTMKGLKYEVFTMILLDSQNRIIKIEEKMFKGSILSSAIYPREIMKLALDNNAIAMIFAHNHPGGEAKPSKNDLGLTRDLLWAALLLDLYVYDHIIIAGNNYYSFNENGLMERFNLEFENRKFKQPLPDINIY